MHDGSAAFSGPVLCLLSENDLTAQQFRDRIGSDADWQRLMRRSAVEVDDIHGADHTFSSSDAAARHLDRCVRWLGQRVCAPADAGGGANVA